MSAKHDLDLAALIRRGDSIVWSQTCAEPLTLTEALVAARARIGGCLAFVGATFSQTLQAEHADFIKLSSFGGLGENRRLIAQGALTVLPFHGSELCAQIENGVIACDVALLQLSPPGPDGNHSLGIANDYMLAAARRARVVIAEVNAQMPWTRTSQDLAGIKIDHFIYTDRPLIELPRGQITNTEKEIARHAAPFIEHRSVLELGIGSIPEAILTTLRDRQDLGIHSGVLGDAILELVSLGVITNAHKKIDTGQITTAGLMGTRSLYDFAQNNPALNLKPYSYTHAHHVLSQINNFVAINSAIEVDLTGQVNAEMMQGHYVGATGGLVDFVRGALAAKNGRSIIALPSSTKNASISRIVHQLNHGCVTSSRCDADIVVTEFGAAQLRGQSIAERIKRMIAIAHPNHREQLTRDASNLVG